MKYYKSFKLIKIFNFFEVVETKDLRYLLILDDYNDLPEVSNEEMVILYNQFKEISDNYTDYSEGVDKVLEARFSILNYEKKKLRIENILFLLRNFRFKKEYDLDYEYLENELKGAGYNIDYKDEASFYKALDLVNTKGIDYRIEIKEKEIKYLQESEDNSDTTYRDAIAQFHEVLGVDIDIHKKTMVDYISYRKLYYRKINQLKKNNKAA